MSRSRHLTIGILLSAAAVVACYFFLGFYTIQPIGALPEGKTILVRRASGEPFFNSPDGTCLRRLGEVSILCRLQAMRDAPLERILLRLPYSRFAYLRSTGGAEFDR
jgi:hypothetical protein